VQKQLLEKIVQKQLLVVLEQVRELKVSKNINFA